MDKSQSGGLGVASHIIDFSFLGDQFGSAQVRRIFSEEATLQKWLDVEAALTTVEARHGLVPEEAAAEISAKAKIDLLDMAELKRQADTTWHPVVPLIRAFEAVCAGMAGEFVHWGATSYDIINTGMVLQVKEVYGIFLEHLKELDAILCSLARKHRDTLMAGRTHGQHALPITFGLKIAVWVEELRRDRERIEESKKRVLVGTMGGAVGSLASFGEQALQIRREVMEMLGLGIPAVSTRTDADRWTEFVAVMAMLAATLERMAQEVYVLQRPEIDEVREPFAMGKVGSSTMAQKRNPQFCDSIRTMGRIVRNKAALALETMLQEHEAESALANATLEFVPVVCIMVGGMLELARKVFGNLTVLDAHMKRNLEADGGLILSEAVMMRLAQKLGRQSAHELVYKAAMRAVDEGLPFRECLMDLPGIARVLDGGELERLLDPQYYTGQAGRFVDMVCSSSSPTPSTNPESNPTSINSQISAGARKIPEAT